MGARIEIHSFTACTGISIDLLLGKVFTISLAWLYLTSQRGWGLSYLIPVHAMAITMARLTSVIDQSPYPLSYLNEL